MALTDQDREILSFERQWWKFAGAKEEAIRELFHLSSTRYYQRLSEIIADPAALEVDPLLVRRLVRIRDKRKNARLQLARRRGA